VFGRRLLAKRRHRSNDEPNTHKSISWSIPFPPRGPCAERIQHRRRQLSFPGEKGVWTPEQRARQRSCRVLAVPAQPTRARRHGWITRASVHVHPSVPTALADRRARSTAMEPNTKAMARRWSVGEGELGSARARCTQRRRRDPAEAAATRGSGTRRVHRNSKSPSGHGQAPSLNRAGCSICKAKQSKERKKEW
jgi:hypothetical protein